MQHNEKIFVHATVQVKQFEMCCRLIAVKKTKKIMRPINNFDTFSSDKVLLDEKVVDRLNDVDGY